MPIKGGEQTSVLSSFKWMVYIRPIILIIHCNVWRSLADTKWPNTCLQYFNFIFHIQSDDHVLNTPHRQIMRFRIIQPSLGIISVKLNLYC